jgi:hypothetical protein
MGFTRCEICRCEGWGEVVLGGVEERVESTFPGFVRECEMGIYDHRFMV